MTSTTTRPAVTSADRLRQVGVTVSEVLCVLGTLAGVGVIGTRVEESSGGALAADATLLAPAGPAFSIWSVVYLGLAAYTVWQWLPRNATSSRTRRTGWLVAASMLLNATWLLVTQQGWIWVSVLVIAALMAVLARILVLLTAEPADGVVERVVVDGTLGLYAGWVAVATCANVAAALVDSGVSLPTAAGEWVAVVVLAVAAVIGVLLAQRLGGRVAVALAMGWGLAWIAVGRLGDAPASAVVGLAAVLAAVVVLGAAVQRRVLAR